MPARMLQAFSQEVTDFDRQMGCMAGVFQIFDGRRLLTARQRGGGRGARSALPPGHALPSSSNNVSVQNSATPNITMEKTFSRSTTENSSLSMELSRASSSSPSCSSFSSLDGKKPVQQGLPNINEELFVGRPHRSSPILKCSKIEAKSRHPNNGFRDIVKDSINRDSHVLAVKASMKEARNGLHKDSPRPLLISKSTDGTYVIGIDRSAGVHAYVHESRRPPRFSCDDRQLLRPVEAQGSKKPSTKLRELPRLSLDSRKESMNPSSRLKNFGYTRTDDNLLDALKPQESPSHQRASSVIAKLMGLAETPDIHDPARSARPVYDTQDDRLSQSPRSTCRDPSVPQPKNQYSPILKAKPSPKVLTEVAPWRQQERGVTGYDSEARPRSASVYADIQRRLRGLELLECNKDLRALRILGALRAMDTPCKSDTNVGLMPIQKAASERTTNSEKFQSPIVIMKPARGITKPDASLALVAPLAGPKGLGKLQHDEATFTRKNENRDRKRIHSPNGSSHSRAEEPVSGASSPRPSSSLSPRLVQKKADSERRSRPPVPLMSPGKKSNEAVSPRGRLRSKALQAKSICNNDEVLQISESKISLAKQVDVGVIDYPNPLNVNSSFAHQSNTSSTLSHAETSTILSSDKKIHPLENIRSPVSVLDASFYHDGSSPSLKRISDSFKDGETHTSDECWNPTSLPDTPPSKTSSEGNQIKPENMKALIQKLELLQLLSDDALNTNEILSSVTVNKDHKYIYEILSASGLLHNELSFGVVPRQLRPSSYSINPELYLILEQAKPETEKLHRRLIFDLANELIAQKMHINHSASRSAQFLRSKKLRGWQLFKDLCAEIDGLRSEASMIRCSEDEEDESMLAKDAIRGMKGWKSFDSELQGMVLDIERSIFKDLIDEVISDEATGKVQLRQWKLRRQFCFSSI